MSKDNLAILDEIHRLIAQQSELLKGDLDADAILRYGRNMKRIRELLDQLQADSKPQS